MQKPSFYTGLCNFNTGYICAILSYWYTLYYGGCVWTCIIRFWMCLTILLQKTSQLHLTPALIVLKPYFHTGYAISIPVKHVWYCHIDIHITTEGVYEHASSYFQCVWQVCDKTQQEASNVGLSVVRKPWFITGFLHRIPVKNIRWFNIGTTSYHWGCI